MNKRKVNLITFGFGKKPIYSTSKSAGADLYSANISPIVIEPLQRVLIPTGVKIELPDDAEAQIRSRSGLALNKGITVLNSPGTIDADYQGEIGVILINLSGEPFVVNRGDRIAQIVFNGNSGLFQADFQDVSQFTRDSDRGEGGFGHTGNN